jgi:hypothetical protein
MLSLRSFVRSSSAFSRQQYTKTLLHSTSSTHSPSPESSTTPHDCLLARQADLLAIHGANSTTALSFFQFVSIVNPEIAAREMKDRLTIWDGG